MNTKRFQDYNYDPKNPARKVPLEGIDQLSVETCKKLLEEMTRLRRVQIALLEEYHPADEMRCPVHFCIGQESLPATLSLLLKPEDYLFSHHRSHGFYFSKVHGFKELFAELYGKDEGANGGKAGSQDISMSSANFYSGAILAGGVPLAAGAAFTIQQKKLPWIAVTASGDGATDEGVYWETLNYAALKKLPMIFLCENNYYSTYSPQCNRNLICNLSERVESFGVQTRTFFGNDVVKAYQEMKDAISYVRSGQGPIFIEAFTYRWNSHVGPESDDYIEYRSKEEVAHWKNLCPIKLLQERLVEKNLLTETEIHLLHKAVDLEIAEAFDFAKKGKFPTNADWHKLNYCGKTPLADQLLIDEKNLEFNQNQNEAIPGPY